MIMAIIIAECDMRNLKTEDGKQTPSYAKLSYIILRGLPDTVSSSLGL